MMIYDLDTTHPCFCLVPKNIHPSLDSTYIPSSHDIRLICYHFGA